MLHQFLFLKYQKEVEYFKNIGFITLQAKFQDIVNILAEIEAECAQEEKKE